MVSSINLQMQSTMLVLLGYAFGGVGLDDKASCPGKYEPE